MLIGMTKWKTTISVERSKIDQAQQMTGAGTISATVDIALDRLIRSERLRRDIAAYAATPPTEEEAALATIDPDWSNLTDDTDWESVYPQAQPAEVRDSGEE